MQLSSELGNLQSIDKPIHCSHPSTSLRVAVLGTALGAIGLLASAGCQQEGANATSSSQQSGQQRAPAAAPLVEIVAVTAAGQPTFIKGELGRAPLLPEALIQSAAPVVEVAFAPSLDAIAPALNLPADRLVLAKVDSDALGFAHARFSQRLNGLEVVHGDVLVHTDATGSVYAANGGTSDGAIPSNEPTVDRTSASFLAGANPPHGSFTFSEPRLVYLIAARDRSLHLAWEMEQRGIAGDGLPTLDRIFVDAHDGTLVERNQLVRTALRREIYQGDSTGFDMAHFRDQLRMAEKDVSPGGSIEDAYDHVGTTYNCFHALFGRDSFDDKGTALVATVDYDCPLVPQTGLPNQAFWWPVVGEEQVVLGTGDGVALANLATSLDVVAHEIGHGVNGATADFAYVAGTESGALDEAWADISAVVCTAWSSDLLDDDAPADDLWRIGEDVYTPTGATDDAFRHLHDPQVDGRTYDFFDATNNWNDPHDGAGISGLAFKLLSTGGQHPRQPGMEVPRIGMTKAAQIFYRALTAYLLDTSTHADARAATVQAATDLYDADTVTAVGQAWDAVGVTAGQPLPQQVTSLTNSAEIGGIAIEAIEYQYFSIQVPSRAKKLVFKLSGGTGDADLYVSHGVKPTMMNHQLSSEQALTNDEEILIEPADEGLWFVSVYGWSKTEDVTLSVSYEMIPDRVLVNNAILAGLTDTIGGEKHFTFDVPAGVKDGELAFQLSSGVGDADIYVRFDARPTESTWDYCPYQPDNNETVVPATANAGTWHVMVRANADYDGTVLVASTGCNGDLNGDARLTPADALAAFHC
ncbi:MAG: M4 family metallopeptidase, partial [Pseudomonadota bacterium]